MEYNNVNSTNLEVAQLGECIDNDTEYNVEANRGNEYKEGDVEDGHHAKLGE